MLPCCLKKLDRVFFLFTSGGSAAAAAAAAATALGRADEVPVMSDCWSVGSDVISSTARVEEYVIHLFILDVGSFEVGIEKRSHV